MKKKTRFAPSPTGYLHVGNIRTALIAWLDIKAESGEFILRIDDTDLERSKEEYVNAIIEDLKWIGIDPDVTFRQSSRFDRYNEVIEQLKHDGFLYPCFETTDELELKRKSLLNQGKPPIYDRASLKLSKNEIQQYLNEGKKVHWRFKLPDNENISWNDKIRGNIEFQTKNISDPILIREDGNPTYMLPSVIDDIDYNITSIIRGEDHISNTAIQIKIMQILGADIPDFAHLSLLKTKEDNKISKRKGSLSIRELKQDHIDPMSLVNLLSHLGSSNNVNIQNNIQDILVDFDISTFGKSQVIFTLDDVYKINTTILHKKSFNDIKQELKDSNDLDENMWEIIKPNIYKVSEINEWVKIFKNNDIKAYDIEISEEDKIFLKDIIKLLDNHDINQDSWKIWLNNIKNNSNRKGKEIFMPIRVALTGKEFGPSMSDILQLLGYKKIVQRIENI